jgi:hypothetical protein
MCGVSVVVPSGNKPGHDMTLCVTLRMTPQGSGCVNAKGIAITFWRECIDVGDVVSGFFHHSRDEE